MQYISDADIEAALSTLSPQPEHQEKHIQWLAQQQPAILAYTLSPSFEKTLTKAEREYLLYLTLAIYTAIKAVEPNLQQLTVEQISQAEEANWKQLQAQPSGPLYERLTVFFDSHPQDSLLSFIEDALADDDESPVTLIGQEAIFIALKTIVDSLAASLAADPQKN